MLIAGCGDLGQRIGAHARQRGEDVVCLVRSQGSAQRLVDAGLSAFPLDFDGGDVDRRDPGVYDLGDV